VDAFRNAKGAAEETLSQAYLLAVSKLEKTGTPTRLDKELVALRLIVLVRQGVSRPEALSEAALEFLRRRRARKKKPAQRNSAAAMEPS
jgi:hypothetical protein